jgi:hypothetical protein
LSRRRSDMMEPLVRHNSPLHHHFGESTRADGRLPRHGMIHVRFPSSSSTWSARPRFSCAGAYGHPSADLCGASVLAVLSQGAPIIAARSLVAASPREQSSSPALLPDAFANGARALLPVRFIVRIITSTIHSLIASKLVYVQLISLVDF